MNTLTLKSNIEKLERLTRRERLGELLVRMRLLKLSELVDLMEKHKSIDSGSPFGEFLIENDHISRKNLMDLLNFQKLQDRIIDHCLKELGLMTNEKKWEILTRHEKIGEVLLKTKGINLSQLIEAMEEQDHSPEKLLGEILVEKKFIDNNQLRKAMGFQQNQVKVIMNTIQELMNVSQLPITVKVRHMNSFWGGGF